MRVGEQIAQFFGRTPHEQALDKVAQMRRDLNHIQHALNALERRMRANTPSDQLSSEFTLLYNWSVSLMESLFAMTWAAYDKARVERVIKDFDTSSARSPRPEPWYSAAGDRAGAPSLSTKQRCIIPDTLRFPIAR